MYSKVIVVSETKVFLGLKGVEKIEAKLKTLTRDSVMLKEPEENEEQVQSWLQTACIGWMRRTKNLEHLEKQATESPRANETKQVGAAKFSKSPLGKQP
jgi:hypothetical protein